MGEFDKVRQGGATQIVKDLWAHSQVDTVDYRTWASNVMDLLQALGMSDTDTHICTITMTSDAVGICEAFAI